MDLSRIEGEDTEVMPSIASPVVSEAWDEELEEEHSLADTDVEAGVRDGKFVNYWITTTLTTTTTGDKKEAIENNNSQLEHNHDIKQIH